MSYLLDIVLPTHNRAALLVRTLDSLGRLTVPMGVQVHLYVVGNACTDDTPDVVARFATAAPFTVTYLEEPTAGKSYALNCGIRAGRGEWIAFFDDDEAICDNWIEVFERERVALGFDFAGGFYLPEFEVPPPSWLPPRYAPTVISRHTEGTPRQQLDDRSALMWGGNCAIRRAAFDQVGLYREELARHRELRSLGCEDVEMQMRLVRAGFRGWFIPELQIRHWTPRERLTPSFFREKCYWAGHTNRRFERAYPEYTAPTAQMLGMPRWRLRAALGAVGGWLRSGITGARQDQFDYELDLRWFLGYWRARLQEVR